MGVDSPRSTLPISIVAACNGTPGPDGFMGEGIEGTGEGKGWVENTWEKQDFFGEG